MSKLSTLLIIFNFIIGIYVGALSYDFYNNGLKVKKEEPLKENLPPTEIINSPSDRIDEENIEVYKDKIIINLKDLQGKEISWSTYADTKSMIPTIGKGCNGLEFIPESPEEINIGDMIAFKRGDSLIIHRIIKTGIDNNGWFAITKGDNNQYNDGRISFEDIQFVTFGIIC